MVLGTLLFGRRNVAYPLPFGYRPSTLCGCARHHGQSEQGDLRARRTSGIRCSVGLGAPRMPVIVTYEDTQQKHVQETDRSGQCYYCTTRKATSACLG